MLLLKGFSFKVVIPFLSMTVICFRFVIHLSYNSLSFFYFPDLINSEALRIKTGVRQEKV